MSRQRLSLRDAVRLLAQAIVQPQAPGEPARIEFAVDSALHHALKDALEAGLGAEPEAAGQAGMDPIRALLAGCALFTIHGDSDHAVAEKAVARADEILRVAGRKDQGGAR